MSSESRDIYILKRIIKYCIESNETILRFGDSVEILRSDNIYKNAAAMCILQIGELAGNLSDNITARYMKVPWKQIKGMRNIAAHGYEQFDADILWQTLKVELPEMLEYCTEIIVAES